jgi:hypothetical protein
LSRLSSLVLYLQVVLTWLQTLLDRLARENHPSLFCTTVSNKEDKEAAVLVPVKTFHPSLLFISSLPDWGFPFRVSSFP